MSRSTENSALFRQGYPYLFRLGKISEAVFIDIVNKFKESFDYYGYVQIIKTACSFEVARAIELFPAIDHYFSRDRHDLSGEVSEYIIRISSCDSGVKLALELIAKLVSFRVVQRDGRDTGLRRFSGKSAPAIDAVSYREFLSTAVKQMTGVRSLEIVLILNSAVSEMLRMEFPEPKEEGGYRQDMSEIWCKRVGESVEYEEVKADLVHALAEACETVFASSNHAAIQQLDGLLTANRWKVSLRLRQHLFAQYPSEQTKPWIRELIIAHRDYSQWEHHYEFHQMVQRACECFGSGLLTEKERSVIFDAIWSGPSKEDFREWMGDRFTEKGFEGRRDYFHRKQLQPFKSVLFGEHKVRYDALVAEAGEEIVDDEYSPVGKVKTGFVSYRSPRSPDELAQLGDEDILAYINTWQESRRDRDDWLVEINISALAGAFETVLRRHIFGAPQRSEFWFKGRERIRRPIYIRFIIKAVQEEVKEGRFAHLPEAFELCRWVLCKPQEIDDDSSGKKPHEESADYPAWRPVRRGVVDFVGACVDKDAKTPLEYKEALVDLLVTLCTQPDYRLDSGKSTIVNQRDYLTDAINNTRGIALENIVSLCYWIRRMAPGFPIQELSFVLDRRLSACDALPLTLPEYALFGRQFNDMSGLDERWVRSTRHVLFPRDQQDAWETAFGTFVRFNNPYLRAFGILRDDYIFALEKFDPTADDDQGRKGWSEGLGQHLFMFYVWGVYPLEGSDSLLAEFYRRTVASPKRWARLFDHAGRLLRNTTSDLATDLKERIVAYADWRVAQKNVEELAEFSFWLESKALDSHWRLTTFSRILEIAPGRDVGISIKLEALCGLLSQQVDLVVECLLKLITGLQREDYIYLQAEKAKPILRAGSESGSVVTRKNVEEARELLLRAGRFDFLDDDFQGIDP